MARPTEFDRDAALDSALRLFWEQGYGATSLSQLLAVMQISRSSFYAAFVDKRTLFLEVMALFRQRTYAIFIESRERVGPAAAIPEFFRYTVLDVPGRRAGRGCLMVNTILELADVDKELSKAASAHLGTLERAFASALSEAVHAGDLDCDMDTDSVARYLMVVNQGLRVASREGRTRKELANLINTSSQLLGLPGAA